MKHFLEQIVPQGFNGLPEEIRQRASGEEVMQIELEGDDGGIWNFSIREGAMKVEPTAAEKPAVILATTVAGFREMIAGRLRPPSSGETEGKGEPEGMAKMMSQMLDERKRQTLKTLTGTFKARYCEGAKPDESTVAVEMYIAFGGAPVNRAQPRMTILMPIDTFIGIQTRKLQAPQVFMQGGMKLTGDMSMAMQMQALLS